MQILYLVQFDGFLIYLMLKLILTFNKLIATLYMNKFFLQSCSVINPGNFAKPDILQVEFWGVFGEHSLMRINLTQESGKQCV